MTASSNCSGSNSITNNSNMTHHSKMNSSSYSHSNNNTNNNNNNQQHYYHHNNPHHNNRDDSFKSLFNSNNNNNNNNSPSSLRNNHFSNRFNTNRNTSTSTTNGGNNSSTHTKTNNNNNNNNTATTTTTTTPIMLYDEEGWPLTSSPYHYSSTTTIATSSTPNHKNINNNIPKATTATPPTNNNNNNNTNTTHNANNSNSRGGFFVVNNNSSSNNSSSQASIRRSIASPPPSTQHKPSSTAASSVTMSHTTPTTTTTVNSVSSSSSSSLIIGKGSPMLVCHYRTKKQYVHNTNHVNSQTNLYQFLKFTTPLLHRSQFQSKLSPSISSDPDNITPTTTGDQNNGSNSSNSVLSNSFYYLRDLWSFYDEPYGIDIPVVLDGRQEHVYFVPHLSAIQLFKKRTVSSHTKNNNKEDLLLFEYFETSSPDLRYPLIDKIEELAQRQSLLLDGTIMQLDATRSWYSIAWYPILCHSQTIPWLKGQMITYHNFTPSVNHLIDPVFCDDEFKQEFLYGRSLVKKADHHSTENVSTRSLNNEQASTSTSSTTSDGADGTDTAYEHTYAAPVIGFLPYKVKNETWFANYQDSSSVHNEADFYAPLHLVRACKRVLAKAGVKHPDFEHCVQNCSDLGLI